MRFRPDTMAGQVTLALIVGVVVILGIGMAVSMSDLFGDPPPVRRAEAASRIAAAVETVRRLPPPLRAQAARDYREPGFSATWQGPEAVPPKPVPDRDTWPIERRLRRLLALRGPNAADLGSPPVGVEPILGLPAEEALYGRLRLGDGSWISFQAERDWHHSTRLLRLMVTLGIVGLGLAALAFWLARWMTSPLDRFAEAAERLGTDVGAPPMAETGPREIRTAAHAFNGMQRRIRRSIDERMHMVAAASHDLRTPITRLKLRAEFIEDEDLQARLIRDLDEMEAIIASTMALAREETSHDPREELDLSALLLEIAAEAAEAGDRVATEIAGPVTIAGRPVALKRAFTNLVRNAIDYGIEARLSLSVQAGSAVAVIDDSGPGIPADEREKVFAPFYTREPSRSRRSGGTGLGLSIARAIIRAHDGEIGLEDAPGGGLRQIVTIPLDAPAVPPTSA